MALRLPAAYRPLSGAELPARRPEIQIITACCAEGCPRCVVGPPFSQAEDPAGELHLVIVPLEAPERPRPR